MSSIEEKKFLCLIKLSFDISLNVTRAYTETTVLSKYDNQVSTFLKINKHDIFHLWKDTPCCQCISGGSINLKATSTLTFRQIERLFEFQGNGTPGHFKKDRTNNNIIQHCLCRMSERSVSLNDFDVNLLETLLKRFVNLESDVKMWLSTIREIRNHIAHATSTTYFDPGRLDKWWKMLEGSILGLVKKIPPAFYAKSIESQINTLKNSNLEAIYGKKLMDDVNAENKILLEDLAERNDTRIVECENNLKQAILENNNELKQHIAEVKGDVKHVMRKLEEIEAMVKGSAKQDPNTNFRSELESTRKIHVACQVEAEDIDEHLTIKNLSNPVAANQSDDKDFKIVDVKQKCILLELTASPEILSSEERLLNAIDQLINQVVLAGDLDTRVPGKMTLNLTFTSPLSREELDVFSRVFCTTDKTEIIDSDVMNQIQDYSFGTITRETQTEITTEDNACQVDMMCKWCATNDHHSNEFWDDSLINSNESSLDGVSRTFVIAGETMQSKAMGSCDLYNRKMSTKSTECKYKKVNAKGETPLHLAAKSINLGGENSIENQLTKAVGINARNKWGQTPLHYAAIAGCLQNIETLTKSSGIDVNSRDINGYNALQSLIASNDGESADSDDDLDDYLFTMESYLQRVQSADHIEDVEMHEKTLSVDLRKSLQVLVNAGIDVNNQTVFGDSILHLIAFREDNQQLLKFFISNFPDISLNLINKKNENFLHVYVLHESLEDIVKLFEWIADKYSGSSVKELSSSKDIRGKTPWTLMIGKTGEYADFQNILDYAVSPYVNDNLGNTVLHQTCGTLYGRSHAKFLEYMLKGGADLNAQNMYGEPVLSLTLDEEVFEIFIQFNPNFEVKDRWGRSALSSIMKYRPLPDFLKALMETRTVNVNTRDIYGSIPLHFAAYNNFKEQIELLLKYGADINVRDNLQERPLDTARRHRSFSCIALLKAADVTEQGHTIIYTRITKLGDRTFEEILCGLPEAIISSCIQSPQDIQTLLHLPLNLKDFMNYLLESYHTTSPNYCAEVDSVTLDVNNLIKSLCKQIEKYDSRFEMSVFPSGSMAEGTKIGCPDEFDFILCLDKLNDITDIVMADNSMKKGFASLKFQDIPDVDDYLPFTDADGYFLPILFLRLFYEYLKRALNEPHLWKEGNLYFNVENKVGTIYLKPVLNFEVYWFGSVYKQLKISIDLVPAVYKTGWWPVNIDADKIPLINSDIKAAGCFLTLQNKVLKMSLNNSHCISRTCNTEDNSEERTKKRMLRISAAPAEICLMKSLPNTFRQAYVLAKVLKNVCPEIDIETKQYGLEKINMEYANPRRTKPSELLKSYMLKNSVFYVLDELKMKNQLEDGLDVSQITIKMYNFLLRFVDGRKMHMRPYFLSSDINVFEKSKELSLNKTFIFHLQREFSMKLVLGMLNAQFPRECLAA